MCVRARKDGRKKKPARLQLSGGKIWDLYVLAVAVGGEVEGTYKNIPSGKP